METDRDARVHRFFADPEKYLSGHAARAATRAEILRLLLGSCRALDLIDLGCGDGGMSLQFLPEARSVTLVDRSEGMLNIARQHCEPRYKEKVKFIEADLRDFDLESRFDVVLCIGVLAHVPALSDVLDVVLKLLRPRGRCVLQLSDADRWLEPVLRRYSTVRGGHDTNHMTVPSVSAAVRDRGLRFHGIQRYGLPIPGTGRLPSRVAEGLQRASWKRPRLSRHAVQAVMLFSLEE